MRNRRRHPHSPIQRLRTAIDCMPLATRQAMLAGVLASHRIIVGAYVDSHGGVCPMLAAHRAGARTDFLAFARSWDRFARADRRPRVATRRELRILVTHLRASLQHGGELELDVAIAEHRQLLARARRRARPALPDAADPRGLIVARRLRSPSAPAPARAFA
ncbi:MAG TPA: hypothetical protein VMF09_12045 [Solirubrobacteraceae bacterium]|nr:hypothetical protein [Solirubrobacteraceae bacterium]